MKAKKSTFDWSKAENQFYQTRIVELPVKGFKTALNSPVFDIDDNVRGRLRNMAEEQMRTLYHSVWMMLERMAWIEKVQGISPRAMTKKQCLDEILPIVRSGPAFKEGFQLFDSGNFGGSYDGQCEINTCGKENGFGEYGRIPDFMKDIDEIETPILDRKKVWHGIRCVHERNLCLLKYKTAKHVILQEIRGL